jgi:hypothetical protein
MNGIVKSFLQWKKQFPYPCFSNRSQYKAVIDSCVRGAAQLAAAFTHILGSEAGRLAYTASVLTAIFTVIGSPRPVIAHQPKRRA